MKRKVNRVGTNTLTVSLPSKWAKQYGVEPGDEVELLEEGNKIEIIKGDLNYGAGKEITISLTSESLLLVRSVIGALYRKGYDTINIKYENEELLKAIRDSVSSVIGLEVVDISKNFCKIKNMVVENMQEFDNSMQRMFSITKLTIGMVVEDVKKGKFSPEEELRSMRFNGWKFRDYAMRIIMKKRHLDSMAYSYSIIIWTIEKINRNNSYIYRNEAKRKGKIGKDLYDYFKEIQELINKFVKSMSSTELKNIKEVNEEAYRLDDLALKIKIKDEFDAQSVFLARENARRIQDMTSSLVIKNIDDSMEK